MAFNLECFYKNSSNLQKNYTAIAQGKFSHCILYSYDRKKNQLLDDICECLLDAKMIMYVTAYFSLKAFMWSTWMKIRSWVIHCPFPNIENNSPTYYDSGTCLEGNIHLMDQPSTAYIILVYLVYPGGYQENFYYTQMCFLPSNDNEEVEL